MIHAAYKASVCYAVEFHPNGTGGVEEGGLAYCFLSMKVDNVIGVCMQCWELEGALAVVLVLVQALSSAAAGCIGACFAEPVRTCCAKAELHGVEQPGVLEKASEMLGELERSIQRDE